MLQITETSPLRGITAVRAAALACASMYKPMREFAYRKLTSG